MSITIRKFADPDIPAMTGIWNSVVDDAKAFPQDSKLGADHAGGFFAAQTFTGVAVDDATGEIVGLYILHPNNVGRCGHICNASYAVKAERRGEHIGEQLVRHSLGMGAECGFRILQFNAVTESNKGAQALYEKLGFTHVGTVPEGFRRNDGTYDDIRIYIKSLIS